MTLAALRLRKGARFTYEYDLNIPWRHEVRIEDRLRLEAGRPIPSCTGGRALARPRIAAARQSFMACRDERFSFDALEDLDTMAEVMQRVMAADGSEPSRKSIDEDTRWRLEAAVERAKAREVAQGRPFSRRAVNASLRDDEHHNLMHQQC